MSDSQKPARRVRPGVEWLEDRATPAAAFAEFVDPHPAAGNKFGDTTLVLGNGNVVVTAPFDDFAATNAGAVYLFNGATGALISTLRGSAANDQVGSGGVIPLANGNYVVLSPAWHSGGAAGAGAATFGSGTAGVAGTVSAANSLVGETASDGVGKTVVALANGNYVVNSPSWDNGGVTDAGSATFGSGTTGVAGPITSANSLVGTTAGDRVGFEGVKELTNGNYVVSSALWDNGGAADAGAVTLGSGTSGVVGNVSAANSLVGALAGDEVGSGGRRR